MATIKKRSLERYDLKLPASLAFEDNAGQHSCLNLFTRNICAGGAFLETSSPLPLGTSVKLDLSLPMDKFNGQAAQHTRISVSGAVIRSDNTGMAVCFDERYEIISNVNGN